MHHGLSIGICIGIMVAGLVILFECCILHVGLVHLFLASIGLVISSLLVFIIFSIIERKVCHHQGKPCTCRYNTILNKFCGDCIFYQDSLSPTTGLQNRCETAEISSAIQDPATGYEGDRKDKPIRGPRPQKAVSTIIGVILIIFLVISLSGVMYVLITGLASSVQKTAYVATEADIMPISPGIHAISVMHRGGDAMFFEGQAPDAQYEVRFVVDIDDVSFVVRTAGRFLSDDTTWSPGDRVIIFLTSDGFFLSNDLVKITGAAVLPDGTISVRIIDNTNSQLIAYQGVGAVRGGETETPTPVPTTPVTTVPTTIPTTLPTVTPTPLPTPYQTCSDCAPGESFTVGFTWALRPPWTDPLHIRFNGSSSPQPNSWTWSFGDGGTGSGPVTDHRFSSSGSYLITLTVKRMQSPCSCTYYQWITV